MAGPTIFIFAPMSVRSSSPSLLSNKVCREIGTVLQISISAASRATFRSRCLGLVFGLRKAPSKDRSRRFAISPAQHWIRQTLDGASGIGKAGSSNIGRSEKSLSMLTPELSKGNAKAAPFPIRAPTSASVAENPIIVGVAWKVLLVPNRKTRQFGEVHRYNSKKKICAERIQVRVGLILQFPCLRHLISIE